MAANRRIYYGIEAVGFAPLGGNSYTALKAVQSAGINTNFTLQQISELGQTSILDNVEILPEVEMTLEKCLDGTAPLWCQATVGATGPSLPGRWNARTGVAFNIYGDTQNSASGTPISGMAMSGMYTASPTFSLVVDGVAKENLTLQGNDKLTINSNYAFLPNFTNTDVPFALTSGSGGIQRRQDMIFYPILGTGNSYQAVLERGTSLDANSSVIAFYTVLPQDIPGISASGTNDRNAAGDFGAHVQDITVTCGLSRENIFEQGRQGPYFKYPSTPCEITTEISVIGTLSDNVSCSAEGVLTGINAGRNLQSRTIKIRMREGLWIDLGTKNKLSTVGFSGGGTDGSNVVITYTYKTYNDFTVTHPQDPSQFVWPY